MQYEQFNEKYHLLRNDVDPNSLFSSFRIFKTIGTNGITRYGQKPPYPIMIDDPTAKQVLDNLNKSDVLLGLSFVGAGFLASILTTRSHMKLQSKFLITRYLMWWYSSIGIFMAMSCSYHRLTGHMENGLRWKEKDLLYSKYDLTSEFERNTIFKHFRDRVD